ncbi:class I SAM-dependent methyltransferase [Geodermatophilus sp. SYSU D00700]
MKAAVHRMFSSSRRWNHNIAYHPVVLTAVPDGCARAIDVGCGEGLLTREMRNVVEHVVGVDSDAASVHLARAQEPGISYLVGDLRALPFRPETFDFVASVAALHHVDAGVGLARLSDLLRPGGVLAVVGLARSRYPVDLPHDLAAAIVHKVHGLLRPTWEHPSPTVWPPPETYAGMRRLTAALLPGRRFRRHLLWRYSVVWTKPDR